MYVHKINTCFSTHLLKSNKMSRPPDRCGKSRCWLNRIQAQLGRELTVLVSGLLVTEIMLVSAVFFQQGYAQVDVQVYYGQWYSLQHWRWCCNPSMLTDRRSIAPAQRHLNQPQVRTLSYLRPLAFVNGAVSSTSPASASVNNTTAFMLLNPHSLNNKGLLIHDIITDRKIDFLCLTETWQHQQDF